MSVYDSIPSHFHAELFTRDSLEVRDSPTYCIPNVGQRILLTVSRLPSFCFRQRTDLSKENLKHLEKVFRNHLAKDNEEFTLAEFKQIVPSKNVSLQSLKNDIPCVRPEFRAGNKRPSSR